MKNKITLNMIENQVLEGTKDKNTDEYLAVFSLLPEEEKLKRYRFFIECIDFPNQDAYLKTSADYADYISNLIQSAIPYDKLDSKDMSAWHDLKAGRLTVQSYKFLSMNLWMIHSTQLLKCKNCSFEDIIASITLKDVELKADGTPYDSYIEFVLKAFSDRKSLVSYVKKFQTTFIDKAGYLYLCKVNERLGRQKGNYVDYKDIRVCDYIFNTNGSLVMVKIGVKPDYVPQASDKPAKKKKGDSYTE